MTLFLKFYRKPFHTGSLFTCDVTPGAARQNQTWGEYIFPFVSMCSVMCQSSDYRNHYV